MVILRACEEQSLDLLEDGRCQSIQYSAKYGTSTLMNSKSGEILDFYVIHEAQVENSAKMELAGPKSLLTSLESMNVTVNSLMTDQHQQVRAYMEKEKPNINYLFDI